MEEQYFRSDEELIKANYKGETEALNILFKRYYNKIHYYILQRTWFKGKGYIDDITQQVFMIACRRIKQYDFSPRGKGSFKQWLYGIAYFEYMKNDLKRTKRPKTISQLYHEEETGFLDDLLMQIPDEEIDHDIIKHRVKKTLKNLSAKECYLMTLLSQNKTYKEILECPMFSKYSLAYLKLKIYNIRKKLKQQD